MQVGLYLELAHELGILPVACVHSAHPVVHQCPTLHTTRLCLGIGMSGRTFSKVGEIHLNLLRALDMAMPGKWDMSLSSACCVTMQSYQMKLSHTVQLRLVTAHTRELCLQTMHPTMVTPDYSCASWIIQKRLANTLLMAMHHMLKP